MGHESNPQSSSRTETASRRAVAASLAGVAVLGAGCLGGNGDEPTPSPTPGEADLENVEEGTPGTASGTPAGECPDGTSMIQIPAIADTHDDMESTAKDLDANGDQRVCKFNGEQKLTDNNGNADDTSTYDTP